MKKNLSKKKLKKMIAFDFTNLSTEEIKVLIQKEADKEPDEIDTDYIDLCFELLSMKSNSSNAKKVKFTKPAKILFAVAALMVVFISTITVSAQFNLNIPQKIAQLINGNAEIDYNLEYAHTTADRYALLDTDLAKQFVDYGITPVTFPEEMIKGNCKITEIENKTIDETVSEDIYVHFEYNGCYCNLSITQFCKNLDWVGKQSVTDVVSGQIIQVNGMDVLIFEQTNGCTVQYKDNLTEYNIYLGCDIETAIKFAKSIK